MNLDEAVPDHRVELLQKWMADPKLMAQLGFLDLIWLLGMRLVVIWVL